MNSSTQKDQPDLKSALHWYHWLVVAGSLVLTLCAWRITSEQAKDKMQEQFDFQAKQIVQLVQERMEKYEEALWAGVAALHVMPVNADRIQWRGFAEQLKIGQRFPGINGIGVIHMLTPETLPVYLKRQREILPDYDIHPPHEHNEYWPITYIEPQDINTKAVGLDMAHEENRFNAAKKSRDTGTAQITGPITLVQDSQKKPGFLFYVPWYNTSQAPTTAEARRRNFVGLVYAPFIMYKLMDGTLANAHRQVNFSLHDGEVELYNELNENSADFDESPLIKKETVLELYGRPWRFEIQTSRLFRAQHTQNIPTMILLGGMAIDSLLLLLFVVLVRANKKAIVYAGKMSGDLEVRQAELMRIHGRLTGAMNAMMDALIVIDSQGVILELNDTVERLFGYKKTDLVNKNVKLLMPNPHRELHDNYLARRTPVKISEILGKERTLAAQHADGHTFPIKLSVTRGESNGERFYTGVIHDLSALNESQQSLLKTKGFLRAAMHNASSGYIVTDMKGIILEANVAFGDWLSFNSPEIVGQPLKNFIARDSKFNIFDILELLVTGQQQSLVQEVPYINKDGQSLWGLSTFTSVRDDSGSVQFIVGQIISLEEQKQLEKELADQNSVLQEANRELNQFAYIASHDLKEPLRTLRTFTSYLLKDLKTENWERVAQDADHVEKAADRMSRLVSALLDLSRAGNSEITAQAVMTHDVAQEVVQNLRAQLEETETVLTIRNDVNLTVLGEKNLLVQAVQNLVSNAIKFHKPDQKPRVDLTITQDLSDNKVEIVVEDAGIGIVETNLETIFLPFKRLHGVSEYEGTGIGLAIVKKIVDRHHGSVLVSSALNQGSRFVLRLPLVPKVSLLSEKPVRNNAA